MKIEIIKIETFDSTLYAPYLVTETRFLWWTFKHYEKICRKPVKGYYPQWVLDSQGSDEYDTEQAAAKAGENYLKWLTMQAIKRQFGTKRSIESTYAITATSDNSGTTINIKKIENE